MSKIVHIPLSAREWPIVRRWSRLDDLCSGVFDCPHTTPVLEIDGPYVVRSQDIRTGIFQIDQAARVSEATYLDRIERATPTLGDLLYSREGTYFGVAAEVPRDVRVCLGQRMVLIRPDSDVLNHRFARYWLNSPVMAGHIAGHKDGSVAERLNMPTIRGLPIPVFERGTQDAIAEILGSLDDKIELNRRMNKTLEASARALFRDWFVDFGPTRAKAEGRPAYLDPDLWSLFPDRLGDDGVPESWFVGTLGDVARLNPESWTAKKRPDAVRYVDLSNTKWGYIEKVEAYDWAGAPSRARRVLRPGDTIVGTVRPGNGSYAYVAEADLTGSTGFAVLRPKAGHGRSFVWSAATSADNIDRLNHLADGGAYPAVRPEAVLNTEVVVPSGDVLSAFEGIAGSLIDRAESNKRESRTLAATRDALLPKLMSGELRVRDAAALVA